ncbi:hypothetical protein JCM3770_003692 [Rhodotorula araucariae]
MVTAKLNGTVLASSDSTVVVEGNHAILVRHAPYRRQHSPRCSRYPPFPTSAWSESRSPPDSIDKQYFGPSDTHTTCPWKGVASYYTVRVGDTVVPDAAWYYPSAYDKAKQIEGFVAFYKNKVEVR